MKHQELIDKMSLEEKAAFLSGKNVWQTRDFPGLNIPSVFMADGPHGIRRQAGPGTIWDLMPRLKQRAIRRLRQWQIAGILNWANELDRH